MGGEDLNQLLRDRICSAITDALRPLSIVFAGWEGGSAAFGELDAYSDIDLTYLVSDDGSLDALYDSVETALQAVSPITARYPAPPGRYYKLEEGSEFLLVDVCFLRVGDPDHCIDVERHGHIVPLFDKGNWLRPKPLDQDRLATKRTRRYQELHTWFQISQIFVRKAILRGKHPEAVNAFWAYTMKPLVELLRMRYCPERWDFGLRYLERDLPPAVYRELSDLVFVRDIADLDAKLTRATAWGVGLLVELDSGP